MEITKNETAEQLMQLVNANQASPALKILSDANSKYLRDLKLNFKNTLKSEYLNDKETALLGLALAVNDKNDALIDYFNMLSSDLEATSDQIAEAVACASLLASNNVLYRFRHFTSKDTYQLIPARLRMNIMMNPSLGKEFFELISLAISAVNGCELCVNAHENSLIEMGTNERRIFDAIRLSSTIVSFGKVIR